jgi:hypothetical protein
MLSWRSEDRRMAWPACGALSRSCCCSDRRVDPAKPVPAAPIARRARPCPCLEGHGGGIREQPRRSGLEGPSATREGAGHREHPLSASSVLGHDRVSIAASHRQQFSAAEHRGFIHALYRNVIVAVNRP